MSDQVLSSDIEVQNKMQFRIGYGYDIHKIALIDLDNERDMDRTRVFALAGVEIQNTIDRVNNHAMRLIGHSDADVLLHAIIDAMLGALSLGDIGGMFPDNDPKYYKASSIDMLSQVYKLVKQHSYRIGNIDASIILERPKLSYQIPNLRASIADILDIHISQISVKAKTNEQLDAIGESRAIACHATILLQAI